MRDKVITSSRRAVLLASVGVVLAACSSSTQPAPQATFAHLSPISLNVQTIEVVSAYQNSNVAPNVETRLQAPPDQVLQRWAYERLRAVGTSGIARFTVLNAPVTAQPLPRRQGLVGALTIEPETRYTMTVEAQLEILDDLGGSKGQVQARISQAGTVEEGLTADQRQLFWYRLTQSVMEAFNAQIERVIFQHLRDWIV